MSVATVVTAEELLSLLLVRGFSSFSLFSLFLGCSPVLSRVFPAAGAHFHLILYILSVFYRMAEGLKGEGRVWREGINISFCFLQPLAVISVTRSNVGCHLAADCSAVRNRSVGTSRSLMAAASQSAAHFHSRVPPSPRSQAPPCASGPPT